MRKTTLTDRFGLLLVLIIASIVITAASPSPGGQGISVVALGGSAVVALAVSGVSRRRQRIASVFVIISAIAAAAASVAADHVGFAWGIGMASLSIVAIVAILRRIRTYARITPPVVLAALSIYLFLGVAFAGIYACVGARHGDFFVQESSANSVDYVYFSFVTMTTVGYGDYTASGSLGKMLAITEAVTGQIYLVTVVALLVSNIGHERRVRTKDEPPPE